MWTLWRCVSNWRGLHHPNMPKDWLCGWLHGRRSSPLGDGSQGCSPGGSQLCPGTQNRFSLFTEAPRIDVGRTGRASAHLHTGPGRAHQDHLQPGATAWCCQETAATAARPGDNRVKLRRSGQRQCEIEVERRQNMIAARKMGRSLVYLSDRESGLN